MRQLLLFLFSLFTVHPVSSPPVVTPKQYSFSTFAQDFGGQPRDLLLDAQGNLLVSLTSQGKVLKLTHGQLTTLLSKLNKPHGLAFINGVLYVAETNQVSKYINGNLEHLVDLGTGGVHFTRSLLPYQGNLLVSIGSSCNACQETDRTRGTIQLLNLQTNQLTPFATGLRNSVFMTTNPQTGEIYATEMGRDFLGDNLPPDEINIITPGTDYGWPDKYGGSKFDLHAHVAPLGLAFLPDGSLLVAEHGSWNSSVPVGYKIIKIAPDGTQSDFLTTGISRPVDIEVSPRGLIYISDDKAGKIYLLTPR